MMLGDFASDPSLTWQGEPAMFDTSAAYYFGNSQGGIFGASLMAVQVDVTRGMLGVPGQPYNILLNRSVDFDNFFAVVKGAYPDPIDIQVVLGLVQMLWDRSEPNGYSHHIREPLPNTPAHDVLLNVAIGDHQVTTLGAHIMARAIGEVANMGPVNRSIWGLEEVEGSHSGSAMVEFDFGLPAEPTVNVPMKEGEDPTAGRARRRRRTLRWTSSSARAWSRRSATGLAIRSDAHGMTCPTGHVMPFISGRERCGASRIADCASRVGLGRPRVNRQDRRSCLAPIPPLIRGRPNPGPQARLQP
ncbi:hypothetical protein [Nannocystis pusilla]|uniref:hypothetical protein n=1 Tax=Nannocystis pusilla TaxID=889268 RepID=UPI003B763E24